MRRMYSLQQLEEIVKQTKKDFTTLVDKEGHERFIEGDIDIQTITGFTKKNGKWSLSGTHLMLMLAVSIENAATLEGRLSENIDLPVWIKDKIVTLFSNVACIESIKAYNSLDATSQDVSCILRKVDNNIYISLNGFTASKARELRIQFDLLIDNE